MGDTVRYTLPKSIQTKLEIVTPDMALKFLEKNLTNRNVGQERVNALKQAILRKQWQVTHQGIALGKNDELYDGQHRLWAIVEAGIPVPMNVTRGLDETAREAIDKGRSRSVSDELRILRGEKHTTQLVSIVATCARLYAGHNIMMPTLSTFDDWKGCFNEGVTWALDTFSSTHGPMGRSPLVGALAFAYKTNPNKVSEFGTKVRDGVGLEAGSMALVFRQAMMESAYAKRVGSINPWEVSRKTLRATQFYLEGKTVSKLQDSQKGLEFFKKAYEDSRKLKQLLGPLNNDDGVTRFTPAEGVERASALRNTDK